MARTETHGYVSHFPSFGAGWDLPKKSSKHRRPGNASRDSKLADGGNGRFDSMAAFAANGATLVVAGAPGAGRGIGRKVVARAGQRLAARRRDLRRGGGLVPDAGVSRWRI